MGNEIYGQSENKYQKEENKKVSEKTSIIDSEINIIKKNDLLINDKVEKKLDNNEDDIQNVIIKEIQNINSTLISLKEKNNKRKRKTNEYYERNNFYPSNNYIINEMEHEYIKKKEKIFKNNIKNEIKNIFIKPILEELEKKNKEISEIKVLFEKLNKSMLDNKENLEKEMNSKIGNIEKKNDILSEQFKNHNQDIAKIINKYDNNFNNLNKNIENIKSNIKNLQIENKKETENLQNKFSSEINKLKLDINSEINIKDKKFNSKLEDINKICTKNRAEIEELKEKIKKFEEVQKNLKILDENKTRKLKELDEKIKSNKEKTDDALKEIDLINQNSKKNMQNVVNESLKKFNNLFQKSFAINKYKSQKELKLKLFQEKNLAQVGLNNIGNNCYQNSVLQILKNIPKFIYNFYLIEKNSDEFLLSLKKLFLTLSFSKKNSFNPKEFKTLLGNENKRFAGNNQYDSTIFYASLLNIIQKKINRPKNNSKVPLNMKQYENQSIEEKFKIWKENYLSKNQTFIIDYFYIYYSNEFQCNSCKHKSHSFQCCNYLDFPIVSTKGNVNSLEKCFENYQIMKFIGDCSECHEEQLYQHYILLELPPVLIINLKRAGETMAYFNDIDIPDHLEMDKLIKYKNNSSIYELRGFIKHSGDENFGHNYAFCKNMFDDLWYEYNDSYCSPINGKPSLDKIFLLCYVKVGSDIQDIYYLNETMKKIDEDNNFNDFKKTYFK